MTNEKIETKKVHADSTTLKLLDKYIETGKKLNKFESIYLDNLPNKNEYEQSYMHLDKVVSVIVTKTNFIISGSRNGHIKFWKKQEAEGIEFVKQFRAHSGKLLYMCADKNGDYFASISDDKTLKIFDVVNFDMINMIKFLYVPVTCVWCYGSQHTYKRIAVVKANSHIISIYDGLGDGSVVVEYNRVHRDNITILKYAYDKDIFISTDKIGMLEIWNSTDIMKSPHICWTSKMDTDLYRYFNKKTTIKSICISCDELSFAIMSCDKMIDIFNLKTCKIIMTIDESDSINEQYLKVLAQTTDMEIQRRIAVENELGKFSHLKYEMTFDESGNYLIYPTMIGVKFVDVHTGKCMRVLGQNENMRILTIALFQGSGRTETKFYPMEMYSDENSYMHSLVANDPILFCTAHNKSRFYLFSSRGPIETETISRDVYNERPTKDDMNKISLYTKKFIAFNIAILHTTLGDVTIKLHMEECPKACENFATHAKNGYYNGHIFHRVIKNFMIQTGDPQGDGRGGKSIWNKEFEDEFSPNLKHDKAFSVSMANAGPNSNGSQFFITVVPAAWLDGKHTLFGITIKGMNTVDQISKVKTDEDTDKPLDDIKIISISLKNV
ncbi:hypothetical protein A3Q56_03627 [Intoshia linei]|uniref:peptidylprolyl isomerase n=1 Tax=Intoshia linei TaxID=1819745 RepID=A0A177B4F7_9BILA|nr:hypothetical protein A3Q56_03627 [Intoshia linei]